MEDYYNFYKGEVNDEKNENNEEQTLCTRTDGSRSNSGTDRARCYSVDILRKYRITVILREGRLDSMTTKESKET